MGKVEYYLIAVNMVSLILYLLNMFIHSHTNIRKNDLFVILCGAAGGSLGILLAIVLFDRKAVKDNMMLRVSVICIIIIQIIVLLMLRGHHFDHITFAFWRFFPKHRILCIYLGIVNLLALMLYAIDKRNAVADRTRIRIVTLLGGAFAGGSMGSLLAMYLFRHKTNKDYFTVGVPLIMVMQMVVLFYVMNVGWQ